MKPTTIYFWVNASPAIGLGHFNRCIALAGLFEERGELIFHMNESLPACKDICDQLNIRLQQGSFHELVSMVDQYTVIVTDDYSCTTELQKELKQKGCTLISVDDIHQFHFVSDIVINHGTINPSLYSVETYTQLLLGPEYAILKPDFLMPDRVVQPAKSNQKLLVCLGGTDPAGYTLEVVNHLINIKGHYECNVLTTSGNTRFKEILDLPDKNQSIKVFHDLSPGELIRLFRGMDIAILPASTIAYEACSVGVGLLVGISAENQRDIYHTLTSRNLALGMGYFDEVTFEVIQQHLNELSPERINHQLVQQKNIFDGQSLERLKSIITRIFD